jgi:hypothetical protein
MCQAKFVKKIKIHVSHSVNFFFRISCRLCDNVKKYTGFGQVTDDNMAHAHVTLDSKGYKHTFTEYVIILAFPQQQLLHERAAMLRCLVLT